MKKYFFKIRCAAIILIAAGYGWAGGHYIPAHFSIEAYIFQFIIIAAILIMGIRSLSISVNEKHTSNWSVMGLSIFSVLLLLLNILNALNIIHWGHNLNANSFGSHNSFTDLVPVVLLMTGNGLWATTIVQSMRHDTKDKYLPNSRYNIF
jgi:predicted acyltransferase